jgi:hypothetical protein
MPQSGAGFAIGESPELRNRFVRPVKNRSRESLLSRKIGFTMTFDGDARGDTE